MEDLPPWVEEGVHLYGAAAQELVFLFVWISGF